MLGKREEAKLDKVDTIIGRETSIKGIVTASGAIRIDGRLEGEIQTRGDVYVGDNGKVEGNIQARHVTVAGEIRGNVTATGRIEIVPTGRMIGDLESALLVIGEGGTFIGRSVKRETEGKGQARPSQGEKTQTTARA